MLFVSIIYVRFNFLIMVDACKKETTARSLNDRQVSNLKQILKISEKLHKKAGIKAYKFTPNEESTVIESGHQPNFLPYPGVWKKVFLINYLSKTSNEKFRFIYNVQIDESTNRLPLFGMYDYDQSTSKIMFQNKIPAMKKEGFENIGFKVSKEDRWKRFNSIPKPSKKDFNKVIYKIKKVYQTQNRDRLTLLEEEMWKAYEKASDFPEMNIMLFMRISDFLGIEVAFFKYSDLNDEGILVREWDDLLRFGILRYNMLYNHALDILGGKEPNFRYNEEYLAPFWYHCDCGGKIKLLFNAEWGGYRGKCVICENEIKFHSSDLKQEYNRLSPRAVFRNILFPSGLGTSIYVSGTGGGLKYGKISDYMIDSMNSNKFNNLDLPELKKPVTVAWRSRDYYLGIVHSNFIREIKKVIGISKENLSTNSGTVENMLLEWRHALSGSENQEKSRGKYTYSHTLLQIAKSIFNTIPSFIDLFLTDYDLIKTWKKAIEESELLDSDFKIIKKDVVYEKGVEKIYDNFIKLAEISNSGEYDPINILKK